MIVYSRIHRALYIVAVAAIMFLFLGSYFALDSALDNPITMLRRSTQAVLAAASLASVAYTQQVLDLSTVDWTLTSPNFSYISVPGKVPSQVHLDLHDAQVSAVLTCSICAKYLGHWRSALRIERVQSSMGSVLKLDLHISTFAILVRQMSRVR